MRQCVAASTESIPKTNGFVAVSSRFRRRKASGPEKGRCWVARGEVEAVRQARPCLLRALSSAFCLGQSRSRDRASVAGSRTAFGNEPQKLSPGYGTVADVSGNDLRGQADQIGCRLLMVATSSVQEEPVLAKTLMIAACISRRCLRHESATVRAGNAAQAQRPPPLLSAYFPCSSPDLVDQPARGRTTQACRRLWLRQRGDRGPGRNRRAPVERGMVPAATGVTPCRKNSASLRTTPGTSRAP